MAQSVADQREHSKTLVVKGVLDKFDMLIPTVEDQEVKYIIRPYKWSWHLIEKPGLAGEDLVLFHRPYIKLDRQEIVEQSQC